ncbi:MAG: TIGR00266 family protein [Candidatus Riflebacteria bacterium]|nr:TIGR00266 family protein [Candidatus Riflebacteria bacterium]
MKYQIMQPGSYAMIKVDLAANEVMKAESGAMVAMHPNIDVEAKVDGGMFGALKRAVLTGESVFFQTLKATRGPGEVYLAPGVPGDVTVMELNGANHFFLQKQAFLAGDDGLTIEAVSQGFFKGLLSGEGMFIQKVSGKGTLAISSFGAIHKITLAPGQQYIVDNSHLVAWSGTVTYDVQKASSGWFSSIGSGEGLVCKVNGPGDVWFQTRNPGAFGSWIRQFIPSKG